MFETIMNWFSDAGDWAIDLLPTCPFISIQQLPIDSRILSYISWVIPFPEIIAVLQTWLVAIGIWYVAKAGMRWAKAIR